MNRETALQLVGFIGQFENEPPLYELSKELTLAPYMYGQAIADFISFCYREQVVQTDCYDINDEFTTNRNNGIWFDNLNEQQVCQCIGIIIRQDRFIDGFINLAIKDGTIVRLLNRIKVLYDL